MFRRQSEWAELRIAINDVVLLLIRGFYTLIAVKQHPIISVNDSGYGT